MKMRGWMMTVSAAVALWGMAASGEVEVTNVSAKQRYPWNGLVDIKCTVEGIGGEAEAGGRRAVKGEANRGGGWCGRRRLRRSG